MDQLKRSLIRQIRNRKNVPTFGGMDYAHYTEFENFALIPVSRHLRQKYDDSYADYNKDLSNKYRKAIQEIRDNKLKYQSDLHSLSIYINDLFKKISDLKKSLFRESDLHVTYLLENVEVDNSLDTGMKSIITLMDKINGLFENTREDLLIINTNGSQADILPKNQVNDIPKERYGFNALNPTNLLGAWRLLRNINNKFISSKVNYETFERNFTRQRILNKITWIESDKCLHYFIDGIYGRPNQYGLGIEMEPNGQWEKAADCFCKKDGTVYDPGNLSRTKNPTIDDQIGKLKTIIAQFNKQPKKKD